MPTRYRGSADSALQLGVALRDVLREGYSATDLKRDAFAGLVVGVVALPLAMALAIAVGVPPHCGLYTAILAGFLVAALGGSRTQVTGPTAAFVVVLAPILTKFGFAGLLIAGGLGGLILIAMGVMRLGRFIQFIPYPVTTGFTAGIATVIATMQVTDLFGLRVPSAPEHYHERLLAIGQAWRTGSLAEFAVGLFTFGALLTVPKLTRRIPAPLIALPAAALLAFVCTSLFPDFEVATIASRFESTIDGAVVRGIPRLPPTPMLPWHAAGPNGDPLVLGFDEFRSLLMGAFAIAMLGAIESLLSAVVADGMAQTKHDPNVELLALGIGNLVVPFFGGIPATGAIARTATNVKAGARSPVAAMVHALTVLVAMLVLAPALGYLPMSSLAALLLLVAWNMSDAKHFMHMVRVAPTSDVAVLLTCYLLTVTVDMVVGVSVGMVLAAFLFMSRMAAVTNTHLVDREIAAVSEPIPDGVVIYRISGALFFGAAQKAMKVLEIVAGNEKVVVLSMAEVHAMDATGLVALESALDRLHRHGCLVILAGAQAQPLALLHRARVPERDGIALCGSTDEALVAAARHVTTQGPMTGQSFGSPLKGTRES